jgi:hypothetical protein
VRNASHPRSWQDTRSYLLGVYPYSLQTADDLVDRLETLGRPRPARRLSHGAIAGAARGDQR